MQVVAEEAVMNVAMHAYVPGSQREIIVRLKTQRHYCKYMSYARTNELNQLTMRFPH